MSRNKVEYKTKHMRREWIKEGLDGDGFCMGRYEETVYEETVTGYNHYPFGIRKAGDTFTIDHIPTGWCIKPFIPRLKDAEAIVHEIGVAMDFNFASFMSDDVDTVNKGMPDCLRMYFAVGLQDRIGGFHFQTFGEFNRAQMRHSTLEQFLESEGPNGKWRKWSNQKRVNAIKTWERLTGKQAPKPAWAPY
jgi:hypothetical protein